jgi:hypothetical protein
MVIKRITTTRTSMMPDMKTRDMTKSSKTKRRMTKSMNRQKMAHRSTKERRAMSRLILRSSTQTKITILDPMLTLNSSKRIKFSTKRHNLPPITTD